MNRGGLPRKHWAESFFQLSKLERIQRVYSTREEARREVFDYIAMFYALQEVSVGSTQSDSMATATACHR